ncbi:MAG: ArsI/CadI family heavy metal resistance metalloenzyme [Pseudomonadota bacterium]
MKRFHVNVSVNDLEKSMLFYNQLFGQEPSVMKPDYAKWMLDDPRINFAITTHGAAKGVDHLGLQSDDETEFQSFRARLLEADMATFEQADVVCCYARSSKSWVRDPDNVAWETFVSLGESTVYDDGSETERMRSANDVMDTETCRTPTKERSSCCA